MAATLKYAVVTIGYTDFILPVAAATDLVERLAQAEQVNDVRYSLSSLDESLIGRHVAVRDIDAARITLKLGAQAPLPYFDQDARTAELQAAKELVAGENALEVPDFDAAVLQDGVFAKGDDVIVTTQPD